MDVRDYDVDKSMSTKARRVLAYIVLIFLTVLCLFWFYMLFIYATKDTSQIQRGITSILDVVPKEHFFENIKNLVSPPQGTKNQHIFRALANSFMVAGGTAILSVYFSTMTAYALHVYDFKLKKFFFTFILAIMMIPTQVTVLGFVEWMTKVGLAGQQVTNYVGFIPLILPGIAAPVTFYYMKQYMDSALPLTLIEAARIDGSGEFKTFNQIALPLMKPAVSVQAIFAFVGSWNNYFVPSRVLTDDKLKTVPIVLAELRGADFAKFDLGAVYITIFMAIFPVIVVYLLLSKNIVGGVAVGAVKG